MRTSRITAAVATAALAAVPATSAFAADDTENSNAGTPATSAPADEATATASVDDETSGDTPVSNSADAEEPANPSQEGSADAASTGETAPAVPAESAPGDAQEAPEAVPAPEARDTPTDEGREAVTAGTDSAPVAYEAVTVVQGESISVAPMGPKAEGSTYDLDDGTPGWVTIDNATGVVTFTTDADVQARGYEIHVNITTADGVKVPGMVPLTVVEADGKDNTRNNPVYPAVSVKAGDTIMVEVQTIDPMPHGTTFALGENFSEWASIDEHGTVTVKATDSVIGRHNIPVTVTYPDGSVDEAFIEVTVGDKDSNTTTGAVQDSGKRSGLLAVTGGGVVPAAVAAAGLVAASGAAALRSRR